MALEAPSSSVFLKEPITAHCDADELQLLWLGVHTGFCISRLLVGVQGFLTEIILLAQPLV